MSFFESLFTIFFSDPIKPLPLLWTPSVGGSDGSCLLATGGGLLGLSGFPADWVGATLVGLGGGGLIGGVSFDDLCVGALLSTGGATGAVAVDNSAACVFSISTSPAELVLSTSGDGFLTILLRTCGSGVRLLILLGGSGLGFDALVAAPWPVGVAWEGVAWEEGVARCWDEVVSAF
jgi:hypothetical protein